MLNCIAAWLLTPWLLNDPRQKVAVTVRLKLMGGCLAVSSLRELSGVRLDRRKWREIATTSAELASLTT